MIRHVIAAILATGCMAIAPAQEARAQSSGQAQIERCNLNAEQVYGRIARNIVQVISIGIDPYRVSGRIRPGTGSGIMIEPDLVMTNYHVIQGGTRLYVSDDRSAQAVTLVGGDPALDVALLKLSEPLDDIAPIEFVSYYDLRVGQASFVVGYPLGIGKTIAQGIVSGLDRVISLNTISWTTRYIQTDAAVSPGNSGGALFDDCARVIGLVTLQNRSPGAENIGYALPMESALHVVREVLEHGRVRRAWHGLYGKMIPPIAMMLMARRGDLPPDGFLVETVEPGSAADQMGLRGGEVQAMFGDQNVLIGGDVITEVNGQSVTSRGQALDLVLDLQIGSTVSLRYWREGAYFDASVVLPERPVVQEDLGD